MSLIDAIGELVDAGVQRCTIGLSDLCDGPVEHATPQVVQGRPTEMQSLLPAGQDAGDKLVMLDFDGGLCGRAVLTLPEASAAKLTAMLARIVCRPGKREPNPNDLLAEVGNLLLNGLLGSVANTFAVSIVAPVPQVVADQSLADLLAAHRSVVKNPDQAVFVAIAPFHVDAHEICGEMVLLFEPVSIARVLEAKPVA